MEPLRLISRPPFTLEVYYEGKSRLFRLVVTHVDGRSKTDFVQASFAPLLGIDVADSFAINEKAEAICLDMEANG